MKITKETIDILRNFAAIQPNLVLCEGSTIQTIAEAKNILAKAEVQEVFPKKVGIYDLNEFLSALSLIEDPDLDFGGESVKIGSAKSSLTYRYADPTILTHPEKTVNMPEADVIVDLTADDIAQIRKASAALGHSVVSITKEEASDDATIQVKDPSNSSSNTYSRKVALACDTAANSFDFQFLVSNLKLLSGDYKVSISSKLISHWKRASSNPRVAEYWIALEKDSSFNG
jgi:hypothetical protein|tara:strand:+ start:414 stop:1103 length:690 start_codon:yes stop_codon:yes gene_type:complete